MADWILGTVERQLGTKTYATGPFSYGLYLSDSKAVASAWEPGKLISEAAKNHFVNQRFEAAQQKRKEDERMERERQQTLMETPVPAAEAARMLGTQFNDRFTWLMERKFKEISPAQLREEYTKWRPCGTCKNFGVVGSPLKGTLAFCGCEIGQQENVQRGQDYLAGEIARVNTSFRTRLAQACREMDLNITADALECADNTIVEHEGVVEVRPAKCWQLSFRETDLNRALGYFGDARRVRLTTTKPSSEALPLVASTMTQGDTGGVCKIEA